MQHVQEPFFAYTQACIVLLSLTGGVTCNMYRSQLQCLLLRHVISGAMLTKMTLFLSREA